MDDRQLSWVHLNRQRRKSAHALGDLVARIAGRSGFRTEPIPVKITPLLKAVLGPELASHCAVGRCRAGTLTIYVDEASVRYHLQSEWKATIQKKLADTFRLQGIREVCFK
jgi:hypothetical protein